MADVDVTSPGVWERASDVAYEELKQRELDEEANGIVTADDTSWPRVKGGCLTEQNVKLWLRIVSGYFNFCYCSSISSLAIVLVPPLLDERDSLE